jgi:hypothetical protein
MAREHKLKQNKQLLLKSYLPNFVSLARERCGERV